MKREIFTINIISPADWEFFLDLKPYILSSGVVIERYDYIMNYIKQNYTNNKGVTIYLNDWSSNHGIEFNDISLNRKYGRVLSINKKVSM
jgi:hypothetical protein